MQKNNKLDRIIVAFKLMNIIFKYFSKYIDLFIILYDLLNNINSISEYIEILS
jgi:hypothetical protein